MYIHLYTFFVSHLSIVWAKVIYFVNVFVVGKMGNIEKALHTYFMLLNLT